MKVIVAGCRTVTDKQVVWEAINTFGASKISEMVHGGARGVDSLAHDCWEGIGPIKVFPADWKKNGKAAGPIRNREMAQYADALLAIWDGKSRGTKNIIEEMEAVGKPIMICWVGDWKKGHEKLGWDK